MPELILASQSPRRRELLKLITQDFTVQAAKLDEQAYTAQSPAALAEILAGHKARAVYEGQSPALGCDTVVELDGQVLGKPKNPPEAAEMLGRLSGRAHKVHTGVCLLYQGRSTSFTETTTVYFSPLPPEEVEAVIQTPEPYDKAGGYGIQGWAGRFIPRIEGCYYNVMGLPVAALWQKMRGAGLL